MIENTQQNPERSMILSFFFTFLLKYNTLCFFSPCSLSFGNPLAFFGNSQSYFPALLVSPSITFSSFVHLSLGELAFFYIIHKLGMVGRKETDIC